MTHPTVTASNLYIGLNVGNRVTHVCCVDEERQVVERLRFPASPEGVRKTFASRSPARIVLEVGSQSLFPLPEKMA